MSKTNLLIVLVLIGLAAALVSSYHRNRAEWRNRRVELVVDWPDVQALANAAPVHAATDPRVSARNVLLQLKDAGITTVAVTEDTLETLRLGGTITYRREGDTTLVLFAPGFRNQVARVEAALQHKTHLPVTVVDPDTLKVQAPVSQIGPLPIGLDDDVVTMIRSTGLRVTPRLLNYPGVSADSIAWELGQVKTQCGETGPLIFSGSAVLGNRPLIGATAQQLAALNLTYGTVEFAKTFGDDDLSRLAAANTIRVHSIGLDEIGGMDEPTAVERFVRAARERNIRICYVRLFTNGLVDNPDVIAGNTQFIGEIVSGLKVAKLVVGPAHPWRDDPVPGRLLRMLMGVGIMAGLMLLIYSFARVEGTAFWTILALLLVTGVVLAWFEHSMKPRELLALSAACTFPALAMIALPRRGSGEDTPGKAIRAAASDFVRITLTSFAGAAFVVGMLSGRLFLLKVDEFLGVKLVLVAPVLLVGLYYALGLGDLQPDADWKTRVAQARERAMWISAEPLRVGLTLASLIGLAALAIFVARSGNDPGVGVSTTELKMRALLDKYLLVRPRTKEFLLGHPALLIGLAALRLPKLKRWTFPLLLLGAVGQASIVDTFCHLHTPLFLSLLRAVIGCALGVIIGAVVFRIVAPKNHAKAEAVGAL